MKLPIYTEDEAAKKWCPFARAERHPSDPVPVALNRTPGGDADISCHCLASGCMAWRWVRTHVTNPEAPKGDLIPAPTTYGCCGLAGEVLEHA